MVDESSSSSNDRPRMRIERGDLLSPVPPSSAARGAVRRASSGAIAAVLLTVFGAIALTFGFGSAISRALIGVTPPGATRAELSVEWAEDENANNTGRRLSSSHVGFARDGYLAIPVSRSDLCFDSIERNAGWPPDFGDGIEGGLTSYSVDVTLRDDSGATRFVRAAYISRTRFGDLHVLVSESGSAPWIYEFNGAKVFTADARGVVNLAASE
jgi:hypothetical protein